MVTLQLFCYMLQICKTDKNLQNLHSAVWVLPGLWNWSTGIKELQSSLYSLYCGPLCPRPEAHRATTTAQHAAASLCSVAESFYTNSGWVRAQRSQRSCLIFPSDKATAETGDSSYLCKCCLFWEIIQIGQINSLSHSSSQKATGKERNYECRH